MQNSKIHHFNVILKKHHASFEARIPVYSLLVVDFLIAIFFPFLHLNEKYYLKISFRLNQKLYVTDRYLEYSQ